MPAENYAELFFLFKKPNWLRRRDGGFGEGGIRDREIVEG